MSVESTDAYPHQLGGEGIGVTRATTGGGRLLLSEKDSMRERATRQAEPLHVAQLRRVAELAQTEGDRDGYLLARRWLLLCQSALWQAGEVAP